MPYPYDDETGRGRDFQRPWLGWVLLAAAVVLTALVGAMAYAMGV